MEFYFKVILCVLYFGWMIFALIMVTFNHKKMMMSAKIKEDAIRRYEDNSKSFDDIVVRLETKLDSYGKESR
jgi:hypothetical protein